MVFLLLFLGSNNDKEVVQSNAENSDDCVADWRLRIHRARRRVIMIVMTAVRFKRGLGHPQRLNRVDNLSFFIPLALGDEYGRFIEEQIRHKAICDEVQHCKVRNNQTTKNVFGDGKS